MALTENSLAQLLADVKTYLNITWTDDGKDRQLSIFIRSAVNRVESVYGYALDFDPAHEHELTEAEELARDLILSRVFYANEKALDDWEANYTRELLTLRNLGKIRRRREHEAYAKLQ